MEMTLGEAFARSARKFPKKIACMDDERSATYAELNRRVNRWSNACEGLGMTQGTHVATLSNNCLSLMEVFLGNLKKGLVTVPLDSREKPGEIERQIRSTDCSALIFDLEFSVIADELLAGLPELAQVVCFGEKAPEFALSYEDLIGAGSDQEPTSRLEEDDDAFILFTGGTTGTPKGAVLSHKNLLWNIISVTTENHSPSPEDTIFYPMQMYHAAAMSRFLAYMYAGATFIGSRKFEPDGYLDYVERYRTTFVVGNPTIYRMLLAANRTKRRDTTSMTRWLNTQGVLTPTEMEEIQADLWPNAAYYSSYALTEASPAVTVLKPWDRPLDWGSVGRAYMCTEVRIVDAADQDLPAGEPGEIIVRGPTVFKGYYKEPAETERTLRGGWLHTGDVGKHDERGYLYMVDRLKDMIKTGGLNVYSKEVEEVLARHPGIAEAAVIGIPHPKWGESVCAVIVPAQGSNLTAEDVERYCGEHLAGYKKPSAIHFVDELPKGTFGGKVLKRVLREWFCASSERPSTESWRR